VVKKGSVIEMNRAFDIIIEWSSDIVSVHYLPDFRFCYFNTAWESSFGYNKNEIAGSSLLDIMQPRLTDDPIFTESHMKHMNDPNYSFIYEYTLKNKITCIDVTVEANCKFGCMNNKKVLFMVTRDIQSRADKFKDKLNTLNENTRVAIQQEYAMSIAHDLRTPLAIFELSLHGLHDKYDNEAIGNAECAKWFMKFVVNRIIDSCYVLQGQDPVPSYESINARSIVEEVMYNLKSFPSSVPLKPIFDNPSIYDTFYCDIKWIQTILANIIINACENTIFGHIFIKTVTNENWVIFEIGDTGIGIRESDMNEIFKPFVKLATKLQPEHGLGLGLYDCAWRIRILGGTYRVSSNNDNGTVFHICIPRLPNRNKSPKQLSRHNSDGIRILIVDDTPTFCKVFARQLRSHGFQNIEIAHNGKEGLDRLTHDYIDIAFIDMFMPVMKGDECIMQFRNWEYANRDENRRTKIVLISADIIQDTNIVMEHVDLSLSKPFDIAKVVQYIQEIEIV
jgi:CheY-like chemotaxis protein